MTRRTSPQAKIDGNAFPVVVRVLVPELGFIQLGKAYDLYGWLHENVGLGDFAVTPHRAVLGDGTAFHFRTIDAAVAFLDRFPALVLADDTMSAVYSSPDVPFGRGEADTVCNLYSLTRAQDAMRRVFAPLPLIDRLGNHPPQPEIYPDYLAPIVRVSPEGRELVMARWGMPTPPQYLIGKKADRGVPNIRNTGSPHWRRWLGPEHRCLVPVDRFAEVAATAPPHNVWFALRDDRPAFFAGVWTRWTSVRKVKDGETTDDLFGFLTTTPNPLVAEVHIKAMPVVLTEPDEWERWLSAPWAEAKVLQRALPNEMLAILPPDDDRLG